jgi:hypothetical protein
LCQRVWKVSVTSYKQKALRQIGAALRGRVSQLPRSYPAFFGRGGAHLSFTLERIGRVVRMPGWVSTPATESHLAWALAFSLVLMSLMLCAIVWQADVISYQRDLIRWLWSAAIH